MTPDAGGLSVTAFSTGNTYQFNVLNLGTASDTYSLSCGAPGVGGSCTLSTYQVTLASLASTNVTVTYTAGAAGLGTLSMVAYSGNAEDGGHKNVTITGAGYPVVSTAPQNTTYRDVGKCIENCFDATYAHSTPPYFSLGVARGVSLIYNSSTHKPTPVVSVDVSEGPQSTTPTGYSIEVKVTGSPNWLTLLNGAQIAYFSHAPTAPTRVVAAFDADANGLGTGRHSLTVQVKAHYPGGIALATSATTYLLVNNQKNGVLGAGVSLGGYQRLYEQSGAGGPVVITEGDGSVVYYGSYTAKPLGAPDARLKYDAGGGAGPAKYTRTYLDGSYVEFNSQGRMTKIADPLGNTTVIAYRAAPADSLISTITDPMNKVIAFCYDASCSGTGSKLHHVTTLSGQAGARTTYYTFDGSGRLIRAQDPDNLSDSLAYGANGLLAKIWNRARQVTDLTYDGMNRLQTIQAPSIPLYDNTSGRPTITYRPAENAAWQPATAGTTLGSPKTGLKADTSIKALIVSPLGDTTKFSLDMFGAPTKVTGAYGVTTLITRDGHSRVTRVDEPNGHYQTFSFNLYDQLSGASDGPSGRPSTITMWIRSRIV